MDLILGLLVGAVFGVIVSFFQYKLLMWKLKKMDEKGDTSTAGVMKIYAVRYLISILVLLVVFLTRNLLPFHFYGTLIGAAFGLTIPSQIMAIRAGIKKPDSSK
jgi:hypothetical protein